jgi:signal transduction histidine kinase
MGFPLRLDTGRLWRRLPKGTVRLRLTLLYGALFLVSGAGLLAITYVLVAREYTGNEQLFVSVVEGAPAEGFEGPEGTVLVRPGPFELPLAGPADALTPDQVAAQVDRQSAAALRQLVLQSGIALAIMAVASIWLGWLVAGRALRPLRTITNAARDISASNLHRRLAFEGPDDELKQLANTFDGLLGRLESSFDAQRQFVANASHELRTPLTLERALVEVALADPNATAETLRETCERILVAGEQQERLIEALLTLSRSQRGLDHHEPFDLAAVAAEVLETRRAEADEKQLNIGVVLDPAPTSGDPALGERLVANLVDNAVRHNIPAGRIEVATGAKAGRAVLSIANSGPVVPSAELDRLLQPFQRFAADRNGQDDDGLGLGLSIVHAIATAHEATLTTRAQPGGGLAIEVSFPSTAWGPRER